jgi:hypothetical protein
MKLNKWTVGLAAVGAISLASAAKAEEKASSLMTGLPSTTISGYIDTSAQWNFGTGNANNPPYKFGGPSKADGFNFNVFQLQIDKPMDETEWAAGYKVDLWAGPDANTLGTSSVFGSTPDFAVRQAYVSLRVPLEKGLSLKMGVFDTIVGYESLEAAANPNFTRSYGHTIEPQTHTGLLASYRFCDSFKATAGVADTANAAINSRATSGSSGVTGGPFAPIWNALYTGLGVNIANAAGFNAKAESFKTYMGSMQFTAPESMGKLAGSELYAGVVNGFNNSVLGSGIGDNQTSWYVGSTIATPNKDLSFGVAFDYLDLHPIDATVPGASIHLTSDAWTVAGYSSYHIANSRMTLHGRVEYLQADAQTTITPPLAISTPTGVKVLATTLTADYDLWKNVLSRVELRWDHSLDGKELFGVNPDTGGPNQENAWMLALNLIYKF